MVSGRAHPSGIDAFPSDPRPGIPRQLQASCWLWLAAVAAGLFETALVVVDATDGDVGSANQVAVGVAVRVIGPLTWLAEGGSLADAAMAVATADLGSVLFAASRVVHLGAVIAALILMFHPAVNASIRAAAGARARMRQDSGGRAAS